MIDAAIDAFATKGFHGTTTRDIASAAGMSPAALYVHYRSKEELLHRISKTGHEATLQLVRDSVATSTDPVEQLTELVRQFTMSHARGSTSARIVNYEMAALNPEHRAEIRAIRRSIDAALRSVLDAGLASGAFHTPDTHLTAAALLSLGIDIARWYRADGDWTPEQIAEHYCMMALRIVGAA
ncbi:TetR/AcrR family transcriptional regulator [Pseudonocardia sp. GCM10023141]|uniref:TetR/AcrR family transcriptional regulator n=1 Tax=Pseudonocardia sp. GCM10023141 TaxID=3252653 RepID=UPI00360DAC2A